MELFTEIINFLCAVFLLLEIYNNFKLRKKNKDQADTIKRLMINKDEVHVLLEKLIVSKKKERIELVNQFTFKK